MDLKEPISDESSSLPLGLLLIPVLGVLIGAANCWYYVHISTLGATLAFAFSLLAFAVGGALGLGETRTAMGYALLNLSAGLFASGWFMIAWFHTHKLALPVLLFSLQVVLWVQSLWRVRVVNLLSIAAFWPLFTAIGSFTSESPRTLVAEFIWAILFGAAAIISVAAHGGSGDYALHTERPYRGASLRLIDAYFIGLRFVLGAVGLDFSMQQTTTQEAEREDYPRRPGSYTG